MGIATFCLPSFLRIYVLRGVGCKIGKNVTLSPFSIIAVDEVEIGNDVYISPLVLFFNLKKLALGNGVRISMGVFAHSHGLGSLTIGDFGVAGFFCLIDCTCDVELGKYSGLGPKCIVSTHGNYLPKNLGFSNRYGKVKLGDYVWIMMDVKITSGVTVGDFVIAHAGTLVTTDIPSNSVLTHDRKSFRIHPMTSVYRKSVSEEYIEKWKEEIFADLDAFIRDYFGLEIECAGGDGYWQINSPKEIVRIWDKDAVGCLEGIEFGPHDIILVIDGSDLQLMDRFPNVNWLDVNLNLYHKAASHPLFDYIASYFALKHSIYFTLY